MQKTYITADQLLAKSYALGLQVLDSGYRPDTIVGVWRGGAPVAIAVHELFDFAGLHCDHYPVRTRLYTGIGATAERVDVDGLDYLVSRASPDASLLLVDDVFDSGRSLEAVVRQLQQRCGHGMPTWRIATPYYKPANNRTALRPDYYLESCSQWLVFPHELAGLSGRELREAKPGLADLRERIAAMADSGQGRY